MKLENLPKTTARKNKRLGLGHGSGRGKTAGRGTKGQKARGKIPISFEGGAISLIKRLVKNRIVDEKDAKVYGVKILGDGDVNVALTVKLPVSKGAEKKIVKAGGKVEI